MVGTRPSPHRPLLVSLFCGSLLAVSGQLTGDQANAAINLDPLTGCTVYSYPPVTAAISANQFPPIWKLATIIPTDTAAIAKWNSIKGNVPNIAPTNISLTSNVTFAAANYDKSDPACWWSFNKCTTPKLAGLQPDISLAPEPQTLGYGFDDGPNCGHAEFYDFLAAQKQTATMFYIGSNVMNWPLQAQRAVTDGHEICIHTWSHPLMTSLTSESAFAELYYTVRTTFADVFIAQLQAVKLVAGVTPTCWRPPSGDVDDRIRAIASGLGLRNVMWKYDSNDWKFGASPDITSDYVNGQYQQLISDANSGLFSTAGTIILAHEKNNYTMAEAISFYPDLKKAFAHLAPVGVTLNITNPYAETNFTLPSFDQYVKAHPADSAKSGALPRHIQMGGVIGAAIILMKLII